MESLWNLKCTFFQQKVCQYVIVHYIGKGKASLRKLGTSEVLSVTLLRIVFVEMLKCISLAEIGTISDIVH